MTVLVGVLNKHGVAIAADSAVTMGNTHKVVNSANKIFTMSKYNPVAIMTCNNASFMGTPWDIIIKEYRKQLGKKTYNCLENYKNDFIKFLHNRDFFSSIETHQQWLIYLFDSWYRGTMNDFCNEQKLDQTKIEIAKYNDFLQDKLQQITLNPISSECKSYSFEDFMHYISPFLDMHVKSEGMIVPQNFYLLFYYVATAQLINPNHTGLVIVGYGENEIYPSLISLRIYHVLDGRLVYDIEREEIINEQHEAVICPFAQGDVIQTIMRGISPIFTNALLSTTKTIMTNAINNVIQTIEQHDPLHSSLPDLRAMDIASVIEPIPQNISAIMQRDYTSPLINTLCLLDKEDMANMAESFVSLTSLIRRMQPREETVGGPVDVAVITKGDGFIWIKRKHYFKAELNTHFFTNYFE